MSDIYRNVPEQLVQRGISVHYRTLVRIGDEVEAISFVANRIQKGTRLKITDIFVTPRGHQRGFEKRLVFEEHPGEDFNPKRFKKIG